MKIVQLFEEDKMDKIIFKEDVIPNIEEVMSLYEDVGWSSYTSDMKNLKNAIDNSLKVWTAWDGDRMIGLARVVGDNYSIIYIQDILVLENYQNRGIGSELLKLILDQYKSIRQIVLMTEDTDKTIAFYQKNGMVKTNDYNCITFMK